MLAQHFVISTCNFKNPCVLTSLYYLFFLDFSYIFFVYFLAQIFIMLGCKDGGLTNVAESKETMFNRPGVAGAVL